MSGIKLTEVNEVEFKKALALCFTLVGVTNLPNEIEMMVLQEFIRKEFNQVTVDQLKLAFRMAAAGRLADHLDKDGINHYQQFTPAYFAKIIKAFFRATKDEFEQYSLLQPLASLPPVKLTAQEMINELLVYWKQSTKNPNLLPADAFDKLLELGKIVVSEDDMEDALLAAEIKMKDEAMKEGIKAIRDYNRLYADTERFNKTVKQKAKRYLAAAWFDKNIL